jgi:EpsI family protein
MNAPLKFWLPALLAWTLVLLGGAYARTLRSHEVAAPDTARLGRIRESTGAWNGSDLRFDPRIYEVLSADTTLMRHYEDPAGGLDFWLFVAYFRSQRTGAQIHSPKNCLPGGGWNIISREAVHLPYAGRDALVNRFLISRGPERQVVYYWFLTRAGLLHDEYALKLDLVRNALLRRPTDAAFVRLSCSVAPEGVEATDRKAADFMRALSPDLAAALPFPIREGF